MKPIFTLDYAEFCCAESLAHHFQPKDGYCVSVPISRQNKGFDILLTCSSKKVSRTVTFQVKGSRYYQKDKNGKYNFEARFNNFSVGVVDFVILHILHPEEKNKAKKAWVSMFLIFTAKEMQEFLKIAKTKKAHKPQLMFGIGFDTPEKVFATRGFEWLEPKKVELTSKLLSNRFEVIRKAF